MSVFKRIGSSRRLRSALCWLAARYIRLVWATGDWRMVHGDILERHFAAGRPFLFTFWHGRLMMMPCGWPEGRPLHMLISQHRDGELIARIIGHFGMAAIRGSSQHGGASALRAMVRALRAGECVGATPDGPHGPCMRAGDGAVMAARLGNVPIIPIACSARRRIVLGTWDRFMVCLPFSRGAILCGEPIEVPEQADPAVLEAVRQALEDALNHLTAEADRMFGHEPMIPADARP